MKVGLKTLQEALAYSVKKHKDQKRKGTGAPYIIHPMAVLAILYEVKASKNIVLLAICAILHDVVEDCGVSLEKIARKFGYKVAAIVEELTNDAEEISKIGKTEYLKFKMQSISHYALVIKLCDRLHNISDRDSYDNYISQTEQIIDSLCKHRNLTSTQKVLCGRINSIINRLKSTA